MELNTAQRQILEFIREKTASGRPPTFREIQEHLGFKSVNAVAEPIRRLLAQGLLKQGRSRSGATRGLVPAGHEESSVRRLTLLGSIAAGSPTDSQALDTGSTWVDSDWVKGASFALKVKGASMVEAGIFEDDILIVQRTTQARHGDIVVALWDGETTVKRYEKRGGKIHLVPANRDMKPIAIEKGQLVIQGKVVGLQRKM